MSVPKFEICGLTQALAKVNRSYDSYDCVISIGNPPETEEDKLERADVLDYFRKHCTEVFGLEFSDRKDGIQPTISDVNHILKIADHCKEKKYHRILFHCQGGFSRSPATAIIFLTRWGLTPKQSWFHVKKVRPQAQPNQVLLSLAKIKLT